MGALLVFAILQLCDLATTLVFLQQGVQEANPLIAGLLHAAGQRSLAVLAFKLAGCALALYAWKTGRLRLVRRANVFFGLCAGWNLLAICIAPPIA